MTQDESDPSKLLADMRLIYDGTLEGTGRPLTRSQKILQDLYDKDPHKFMLDLKRLELEHEKTRQAIEAKLAAQRSGGAAQAVDEGHEKIETLIAELLARCADEDGESSLSRGPQA